MQLTEADVARLDGQHDWSQFPTVRQVMGQQGWSREEVWAQVRAGAYVAYRHPSGGRWEWRLQPVQALADPPAVGAGRVLGNILPESEG